MLFFVVVLDTFCGTLELAEDFDGRNVLLLGGAADFGAHFFGLFAAHQRLLLGRLHLPDDDGNGRLDGALVTRVLGRRHVRRLDRQDDGVHQILGRLRFNGINQ